MSTGEFCPKCRKYYGEESWHCRCHIAKVDGGALSLNLSRKPAPAAPREEEERLAEEYHATTYGKPVSARASYLYGLRKGKELGRAELTEHIQAERMYTDSWKKDAEDLRAQLAAQAQAVESAQEMARRWENTATKIGAEVLKLKAFKDYVHKSLDDAGVPHDPEPEQNKAHGCRIEGRLNHVLGAPAGRQKYVVLKSGKEYVQDEDGRQVMSKTRARSTASRMGKWFPAFKYTIHPISPCAAIR